MISSFFWGVTWRKLTVEDRTDRTPGTFVTIMQHCLTYQHSGISYYYHSDVCGLRSGHWLMNEVYVYHTVNQTHWTSRSN